MIKNNITSSPKNNKPPNDKQDNKKQKQSIKKELRILDYRNGKYQGQITQNNKFSRNGLGVLIDDNYSFILGEWKQNNIEGPFFIVYSDQSILYGYLNDKKIGEIVCYEINNEFNMILSKNSNIIIVDLLTSKSILTLKINQNILDEYKLSTIIEILSQEQKNKQISETFELINEDNYTSLDEKYNIYRKRLTNSSIPQHLRDYQTFINKQFQSGKQHDKNQLIELLKTREEFNISFKKCSLTLFIKIANQTNQTKMLGSMNKYENDYEFYKKIHHSANSIEQFVKNKQSNIYQYCRIPQNRPKPCKLVLGQFHKRAITHANQFINIEYIYQIKQNIQKIQSLINIYITNKVAQLQLQNINNLNNSDKKNQFQAMNYTLQEVHQQIYDAVKRKKQNGGVKNLVGSAYTQILQKSMYNNKSSDNLMKQTSRRKQNNFTRNNSPYVAKKTYHEDPIIDSRLNKSKTNLNISQINNKVSPIKNSFFAKRQIQTTSKKYSYLDDAEDNPILTSNKKANSPVKYEGYANMRRLTQDFQNIKRQIQMKTPQKRKVNQNYFKYDNQAYQNSSNKNIQTNYSAKQRIQERITPLSQKKVFRYLPS